MSCRSKHSQAQNLLKSKKIKKEREGQEDVLLQSPYSVSELWHKIQFYLLKETFGYLDSRNSTKLNRYSSKIVTVESVDYKMGVVCSV